MIVGKDTGRAPHRAYRRRRPAPSARLPVGQSRDWRCRIR